ncbi:MAG TPA: helix-hairpin-helix domain-containing protein [Patescibacteria group bacterium]|nr:helix-hairpin-helix domain-containing protein [Patescibacteria group bacterium]
MNNLQIAELLRDVAASYKLKDQNKYKFQIIAYERAADAVEHATSELKDMWDDDKLEDIPGIGPSIAEHLSELFKTGKSKHFDEVMKGLPKIMFEFMKVPGIGAKTAFKLVDKLKIKSMAELSQAAKDGKIAEMEGFGEESQASILKSVTEARSKKNVVRHLLPYAMVVAKEVTDYMKASGDIKEINPLGSLRRKAATIGDIDLAAATDKQVEVLEYFTKYPKTQRILEKGTRTAAIIIPGNIQVDLMVETPEAYGSLLQHFTGSKHHNIALRELALKKGFSLSDYGVKKLKDESGKLIKFATEESLYKFFGLSMIPPEIREDTGEIEAAREHRLPNLVELNDIKADLQIHSNFDIETSHDIGESSMEDIVKKADEHKYEYIAFTEHNPSQKGHTDNNIVEILKKKREKVDQLNYSFKNMNTKYVRKVFNSLEIDMRPDGSLPVPDAGLATLDFALVSIHSSFDLPRDVQTKRVLSALNHPKVKIFAHPTGRKLNEREGAELNWPEVFEFCLKNNKWIEINCDPMRLDLPDTLVRDAVKLGVKMTMGTDAHHKDGMNNMTFGINVARRGWAEKKDIINTLSLENFEKVIQ